jgi:hypothetical protein
VITIDITTVAPANLIDAAKHDIFTTVPLARKLLLTWIIVFWLITTVEAVSNY